MCLSGGLCPGCCSKERRVQVSPRRRGMSQRAGGGNNIYCVLWQKVSSRPFRAPSFVLVRFLGRESHLQGCCRHRGGAEYPTSEEEAWPGSGSLGAQQPSKFGLHTSSTRPHLLKFLKSANYRPTMQLKR